MPINRYGIGGRADSIPGTSIPMPVGNGYNPNTGLPYTASDPTGTGGSGPAAPAPGRGTIGAPQVGAGGSSNNNPLGGALGTSSYQPDPTQFNLPGYQQTQFLAGTGTNPLLGTESRQSQLGNILMAQVNGGGPNPAQAQLQSATDANIKRAMALGQSMPGVSNMAAKRSILDNAAEAQQQEANQAAQLRAQQQLAAQQQADALFAQQQQAELGWGNLGLNADQAQLGGQTALQNILFNAYNNQTNKLGQVAGGASSAASSIPWGSIAGGGGAAAGGGALALGGGGGGKSVDPEGPGMGPGESPPSAAGDYPSPTGIPTMGLGGGGSSSALTARGYSTGGPVSGLGYFDALSGSQPPWYLNAPTNISDNAYLFGSGAGYASGGPVPRGVNVHGTIVPAWAPAMLNYVAGGKVPGHASVSGDSRKNDTVPAMLSPGEVVLPRSVTQAEDSPEKAKAFVEAIKRQHGTKKKGPQSYGELLHHVRQIHARLGELAGGAS